jgi:hypothetical protein
MNGTHQSSCIRFLPLAATVENVIAETIDISNPDSDKSQRKSKSEDNNYTYIESNKTCSECS